VRDPLFAASPKLYISGLKKEHKCSIDISVATSKRCHSPVKYSPLFREYTRQARARKFYL